MKADLTELLQSLYNEEINVSIQWFWDSGIDLVIGDRINGYTQRFNFYTMESMAEYIEDNLLKIMIDNKSFKRVKNPEELFYSNT